MVRDFGLVDMRFSTVMALGILASMHPKFGTKVSGSCVYP